MPEIIKKYYGPCCSPFFSAMWHQLPQLDPTENSRPPRQEQPLEPVRESELTKELHNKNISARWKNADLGVKLPTYFTDTKPNVVNRSACLDKVFNVLCHSNRPLRILQLGDSHVAGNSYPRAVEANA